MVSAEPGGVRPRVVGLGRGDEHRRDADRTRWFDDVLAEQDEHRALPAAGLRGEHVEGDADAVGDRGAVVDEAGELREQGDAGHAPRVRPTSSPERIGCGSGDDEGRPATR